MKGLKRSYFTLLILLITSVTLFAQSRYHRDTLLVGVAGGSPFVVDTLAQTGISLEIWSQVTEILNIHYKTKVFPDIPSALAALEQNKIDAIAGPVSISSVSSEKVKFTQPYFQSGLSILSLKYKPTLMQQIAPMFTERFFYIMSIFLFILGVVGALLWIAEKKANPRQFPHSPLRGIANGMWCAISTMTTTGYGDIVPKTFWGRFLASCWMIISLVTATSFVAGISSVLTLSGMQTTTISTANELRGKKIGVVADSPSFNFCKQNGAHTIYFNNLKEGFALLAQHNIDGIVYDRLQLQYFNLQNPQEDAVLSDAEYERKGYGFAFPLNSTIVNPFNIELLNLQETGVVDDIVSKWVGEK